MRSIFCLILIVLSTSICHAQFEDDFESPSLSSIWQGDRSNFITHNGQLRSQCNTAKNYYIYRPSTLHKNCEWLISFDLDFAPSSQDYVDVYLVSDLPNPQLSGNAYILRIGGPNKSISLVYRTHFIESTLLESPQKIFENKENAFTIKVTIDKDYLWRLQYDQGNTSQFEDLGQVGVKFNIPALFFMINIIQSDNQSAINNHFFDKVQLQKIEQDTKPPKLLDAYFETNQLLLLRFDEIVDKASFSQRSNFQLDGVSPTDVYPFADDKRVLVLKYDQKFVDQRTYKLKVSGLNDLHGNQMQPIEKDITYIQPNSLAYKDIIINEIMIDPLPQIGLPNAEYIELYNRSQNRINLSKLSINKKIITKTDYWINPNEQVIICPNNKVKYFKALRVLGMRDFPSLNNKSGELLINDNNGVICDRVYYDRSWYKDYDKDDGGYSLELINPRLYCSGEENWTVSKDIKGGTPAQANSVLDLHVQNSKPLIIEDWNVIDRHQLFLKLNKYLLVDDIDKVHISVDHNLKIINTEFLKKDELLIHFDQMLDPNTLYTILIQNLKDCIGQELSNPKLTFGVGRAPKHHELLITELMPDPDPSIGLPPFEYIEIYNASDDILDLHKCSITFADKQVPIASKALLPHQYLILCSTAHQSSFQELGRVHGVKGLPSLRNRGQEISLYNEDREVLHTLHYTDHWHQEEQKRKGGFALEMQDLSRPCVEQHNWDSSTDPRGGTPGQINSKTRTVQDNTPPKLSHLYALNDTTLLIHWSEKMDSLSILHAQYSTQPSIDIQKISPQAPRYQRVVLTTKRLDPTQVYKISISGVADCTGNQTQTQQASFAVPQEAVKGDIILNEILFNPLRGGKDFVEIYNRSDKYIDLQDWKLANILEDTSTITDDHYIISPQSYLAISTDTSIIRSHYPKSLGYPIYQIKSLPTWDDNKGTVSLIDPNNQSMQRFDYTDDMHLDLWDDQNGISLERLAFDLPIQEASSWASAAYTHNHATPGYQNSQHNQVSTGFDFVVKPKVISPFSNGTQDYTNISYQNHFKGSLANIFVFDQTGRKVKTIIQNQYLGEYDVFRWDGSNDQNLRVQNGAYIIWIEIIQNSNKQIFKEIIIIAGE